MKMFLTGILALGLAAGSQAAWTLIDDFESYDNSSNTALADGITYDSGIGHDVWAGIPEGTPNAHVYDDSIPGGQSLAVYGGSWRGAETDLKNNFSSDFSLADGETATYFFQFMTEGDSYDCMLGLVENTNTVDESNAWQDYSVMPFIAGGQFKAHGENTGDMVIGSINTGQWYNVWLVVDNNAKQFDVYWSTGTTNSTPALSGLTFGRVTAPVNLEAFAISQNQSSTVHIDNLYMTSGVDTTFPSTDIVIVPPPGPVTNQVGGALSGVTNDTVYLMCYHEGYYPAGGSSGVFISWSTNGYDFSPLNDGHPVFVPPEFPGDDADNSDGYANLVRDPSILYGPDGLFHLVFTSDINSRSFGYAESPDLVHWSNVKLVQIWENEPQSIDHTWAPEIYYDDVFSNCYMVAFSSGVGGDTLHIQYTTTTDFDTWTAPRDLYRKPDNTTVIDGFIAKVTADHYIMATAQNGTAWIVDGPTPYGPWTTRSSGAMGSPREGPALIKIGDTWHLYADYYAGLSDDVFRMAISSDTTNWTEVSAQTDLPAKADVPDYGYDGGPPHHCTVFAAPLSALGAFIEPMQDNVTNLSSLVYRWSFDDAAGSVSSGTMITDSVSGAEAVVNGNRAEFTGSGLLLPGDTTATGDAAYLDLPNGIISSLTNVTVEIWATPAASKNWQRLFSFGRTVEAGDGVAGEWTGPASGGTSAQNAMYWTLNVGSNISKQDCAMRNYNDIYKDAVSGTCLDTTVGTRYHYVFTFEDGVGFFGASGGRMTLYRDGYEIGWRDVPFRLQNLDDVNNWLGRSQWSGDSNANVEYDEVRIYSSALSWYDIYGHYLAGPDVLVNESPNIDITVGNPNVSLRWPGNTVGWLEQAEALSASTVWTPVTNMVQNSTNGLSVTLPLPGDKAFYRLVK